MIAWAMEAVVASAVLMALVLLARAPVRRLFGPQLAYAMWLLPLLRLLMPPLPSSWREQAVLPIAQASDAVMVFVQPDLAAGTSPVAAPVASVPWEAIVLGAWLLGAAMFFGLHFMRHRRFCRRLLAEARVLDRVGGVRVIETPAAPGPLAFGLAQRFVAFPRDFADRYDADERELALAHELGHHARGDLIANWAALGVLAIHWFNPLAWHAFRAFRCDQELANDARVLAGRSRADRHIYACAILKAAHGGAISAACHLHTITDLKGRLRMLTNTRLSPARHATGAAAILTVVTAGLAVTASGTRAAAALTAKVESATGVQIAAPPAPPAPPAPAPAVRATVPKPPKPPKASTRTTRHVVIVKDGKTTHYDGDAAAAYIATHPVPLAPVPPVPPVVSRNDCQPATGTSTMTSRDAQGRRVLVICQNRIRAMTEAATRQAELGQRQAEIAARQAEFATRQAGWAEQQAEYWKRNGLKQAAASIRFARQSIENDRNLSDDRRRDALAGLDKAMRELAQSDQR